MRNFDPMPWMAALLVAGTVAYGTAQLRAERACLVHGYPSAKVTWTFAAYCVKRVDQTDVVVPLKQVAP